MVRTEGTLHFVVKNADKNRWELMKEEKRDVKEESPRKHLLKSRNLQKLLLWLNNNLKIGYGKVYLGGCLILCRTEIIVGCICEMSFSLFYVLGGFGLEF